MSKSYIVSWKIDIDDVDTPVQAAECAQAMMQEYPADWVYEVVDCETRIKTTVDLEQEHCKDEDDDE